MPNSLCGVLQGIESKVSNYDIRRTDIVYADLLTELPPEFSTLLEATSALSAWDERRFTPELRKSLIAVNDRLACRARMTLEEQLVDGVRGAFDSPADAEILIHRMGWTDGKLRKRHVVAWDCGTVVARVRKCEDWAKSQIEQRGWSCRKLRSVLKLLTREPRITDETLPRILRRQGYSKIAWGCRSLYATARFFGQPLPLNLVKLGKEDCLTRVDDVRVFRWAVRWAVRLTLDGQRSTAKRVQKAVSEQMNRIVPRSDIRLVLSHIPNLKFHDNQQDVFSLSVQDQAARSIHP